MCKTLMLPLYRALPSMGTVRWQATNPKGGPDVDAEDVSLIQLLANPQAYDGKIVRIIGFIHLEFEGNVIYLHEDDFRYGLTKNGLWIDLPRDISQAA